MKKSPIVVSGNRLFRLVKKEYNSFFNDGKELIDNICTEVLDTLAAKNEDYASVEDPFKNFRVSELLDVPMSVAVFIRILDKVSRVGNLMYKGHSVENESLYDAYLDTMGYSCVLNHMLLNNLGEVKKEHILIVIRSLESASGIQYPIMKLSDEFLSLIDVNIFILFLYTRCKKQDEKRLSELEETLKKNLSR